jgi:hypothetical protein
MLLPNLWHTWPRWLRGESTDAVRKRPVNKGCLQESSIPVHQVAAFVPTQRACPLLGRASAAVVSERELKQPRRRALDLLDAVGDRR